ncbi:MAG: AraC family transcriptional regulator [Anaerolineales bacterium]|nr:AraC family transcriptional regulator [Anaerolineales bacterium]MCB9129284.1 AraC family transcriptional regulator [Ardenticatenales bacterium]
MAPQDFPPHPRLAPYLHAFTVIERRFDHPHTTFDILPDTTIELVWNVGTDFAVVRPDQHHALPSCYVVGLLQTPLRIIAHGLVRVVRAQLYPWGLRPLLGTMIFSPPFDSAGLLWVDQALHPPGSLKYESESGPLVAEMEHVLLKQVASASSAPPADFRAVQSILDRHGASELQELARELALSDRSLRRHVQRAADSTPKALARLARFEYVRNRLWAQPDTPLATVALEAGYSDQAHMNREYRRFSQRTPRQFLADMEDLRALFTPKSGRNLQDD